jgi:hypothetical protein
MPSSKSRPPIGSERVDVYYLEMPNEEMTVAHYDVNVNGMHRCFEVCELLVDVTFEAVNQCVLRVAERWRVIGHAK